MKMVMVRAWELARKAVVKFGGKVKDYFVQALTIAWAETKKLTVPTILEWILKADTRKFRTWIARIVGTHPVYKLDRSFLQQDDTDEDGDKVFRLNDGYYEINTGKRDFIQVVDGKYFYVKQYTVAAAAAEMSTSF